MRVRGSLVFRNRYCLVAALLTFLFMLYLHKLYSNEPFQGPAGDSGVANYEAHAEVPANSTGSTEAAANCTLLVESTADIDSMTTFLGFDFYPSWLWSKEFWNSFFEERFVKVTSDRSRARLKIVVVPHSHNDPGWIKTFDEYFEQKTKQIINNVINKLSEYKNMTFIWTEIAFLNAWWESAHPSKQKALQQLLQEGRLEITTGGWVMPDEATTHIYALVDQLIEGHLWLNNTLQIKPKTGWAIDAFGHGPTVPYLLEQSGFHGTVIQRTHYAWKEWLAKNQISNFIWLTGWQRGEVPAMIVHNLPFDIYSIKNSCGPHPSVCLSYDFRMIPGEYLEHTAVHEDITEANIQSKAKTLLDEYARIGSLTPHNVVLVPLGDDFRYDHELEFDYQYNNYMKLFHFINNQPQIFNAEVGFGTPSNYFHEVTKRYYDFPTFKGDFFVYSDVYGDGKPAYWSGFYTTRPFYKIMARELEHHLRSTEILFTLVLNRLKLLTTNYIKKVYFEKLLLNSYNNIIKARRRLALFQHHDAITGTSKYVVMNDYGNKLFRSINQCIRIQEIALTASMFKHINNKATLQADIDWETFGKNPEKLLIVMATSRKVVVFNSLSHRRKEIVNVKVNASHLAVFNTVKKQYVPHQVSPTLNNLLNQNNSEPEYNILFEADIPGLSAISFELKPLRTEGEKSTIYCRNCRSNSLKVFNVRNLNPDDIFIENEKIKLSFQPNSGFLQSVYKKEAKSKINCAVEFRAYNSAQGHSGAYLFKPNLDNPDHDILKDYAIKPLKDNVIIVRGNVASEVIVLHPPFLIHTVRIYNLPNEPMSDAIYFETIVDFEEPPKNRDMELFMRLKTDVSNEDAPEFYTDQNGFQFQKRKKVDKLGLEANIYPITNMAWIQDNFTRVTLVTAHAQAATSITPGYLELIMDRRTLYDDYRGMGEGIVDNRRTIFRNWLLVETYTHGRSRSNSDYELPSDRANYLSRALNYPLQIYIVDDNEVLERSVLNSIEFVTSFPDSIHLMSLRSISDGEIEQLPSPSALMVLHYQGFSCRIACRNRTTSTFNLYSRFSGLQLTELSSVSVTGLYEFKTLNSLAEIEIKPMEIQTYKVSF